MQQISIAVLQYERTDFSVSLILPLISLRIPQLSWDLSIIGNTNCNRGIKERQPGVPGSIQFESCFAFVRKNSLAPFIGCAIITKNSLCPIADSHN